MVSFLGKPALLAILFIFVFEVEEVLATLEELIDKESLERIRNHTNQ